MSEMSLVDPNWELIDPNPNIWSLFAEFDQRFFNGVLTSNFVELMWSTNRMTSTAGLCSWNPRTNYAAIKLSTPLLQLRCRSDLVETLLHEMIHAYLFVTREDDNHESHGPKFHLHMMRINKLAGTNITVYHTFHDEVRHYQQHVWRCEGPCANKPPYYGYVRRANNRKPGSYDYWWSRHQAECGGNFVKLSEPEKVIKPKQNGKNKTVPVDIKNNKRIDDFFQATPQSSSKNFTSQNIANKKTPTKSSPTIKHGDIRHFISPIKPEPESSFPGKGYRLGSSLESEKPIKKLKMEGQEANVVSSSQDKKPPALPKNSNNIVRPVLSMKSANSDQNGVKPLKNSMLPELVPQIVQKPSVLSRSESSQSSLIQKQNSILTLSDDEDSFTYDLPHFELDESIIIETVKANDKKSQKSLKAPSQHANVASTSKAHVPQNSHDDEEDAFTYELPNFIPFLGNGFKLGSSNIKEKSQLSSTFNNSANVKSKAFEKPMVVKLD